MKLPLRKDVTFTVESDGEHIAELHIGDWFVAFGCGKTQDDAYKDLCDAFAGGVRYFSELDDKSAKSGALTPKKALFDYVEKCKGTAE